MAFVAFAVVILVLAGGLVPAWLLRRTSRQSIGADLVAAQRMRPAVVANASIAYAWRMAAFVPLFAWGATGDVWPAVIASTCFGLGTSLVFAVRRPLAAFVDDALAANGSITVHAFIARGQENDGAVRAFAAVLALFALFGLLVGEALAAAAVLRPLLQSSGALAALLAIAAIAAVAATIALSGHSGVMHSAQLQLGVLYFGLFATTALVLYLHVSARTALAPHPVLALAYVVAFAVRRPEPDHRHLAPRRNEPDQLPAEPATARRQLRMAEGQRF